ncbi:winged helix-turn-helix domain-containing tetratricopeptide repeat protein [Aliiruegeria lutimaris]|uniref:TolB amino-terminal domain-containing protein n=1 Tax=Aliiruegeria lutimaris TaxID=571298 RepID=A0A1G9LV93_9RHOB|nr:winged helix-turn-helix domain-containing tetratricopeptide repeat protein [Aliiruegeria lutimaris]SDL65813.1 TolB amino-terminal domain-containing protein [Aliiruegeria lutimaris]
MICFLDFQLDPDRGELTRTGAPVAVEPQVFELIAHLARYPGRLITRDELIEHVWDGRIVSDSAISSRINAARMALGDDGTVQKIIKTIPRRGYRFEPTVGASPKLVSAAPVNPSVAILPFENLSGDPEQSYFSDGITGDIITDLSRYDELFVIARHSSFAFRHTQKPTAEIARELGVDYIAEGSVRRAGDRIRVTARLIDPLAGNELWADRYDRDIRDIFEVQDEITSVIVNTLVGEITRQHHARSYSKSSDTVNAYDHFLRAVELNYQMGQGEVLAARVEAKKALDCDSSFSRAHALVAWTHISEASNAWAADTGRALELAHEAATASVAAAEREPFAHAVLGWVYMWRDRAFARGLAEQRQAIASNPGSAQFRSMLAFSMTYAGHSTEAVEALEEAMRLNPYYPELFHVFYGRALFNLHRYDEAIVHLERVRTSQPQHANALAHAAACYAALGRNEEAQATVAEIVRASERYTLAHARDIIPYANPSEQAHFLENLARAGLAE